MSEPPPFPFQRYFPSERYPPPLPCGPARPHQPFTAGEQAGWGSSAGGRGPSGAGASTSSAAPSGSTAGAPWPDMPFERATSSQDGWPSYGTPSHSLDRRSAGAGVNPSRVASSDPPPAAAASPSDLDSSPTWHGPSPQETSSITLTPSMPAAAVSETPRSSRSLGTSPVKTVAHSFRCAACAPVQFFASEGARAHHRLLSHTPTAVIDLGEDVGRFTVARSPDGDFICPMCRSGYPNPIYYRTHCLEVCAIKSCWPFPLPDSWSVFETGVKRARSSSATAAARLPKEDSPPEAKMPRYTSSGREIKTPVRDGYAVRARSTSTSTTSSGRGSLHDDDDSDKSPPRPLPQVLDPSRPLVLPVFLGIPSAQMLLAQNHVDILNQLLRPAAPHPPPLSRPPPPAPPSSPPYLGWSAPPSSWPSGSSSSVSRVKPVAPLVDMAPEANEDAPKRTVESQPKVTVTAEPADVEDVAPEVERKVEGAGEALAVGDGRGWVRASADDARAGRSGWGRWLKPRKWF